AGALGVFEDQDLVVALLGRSPARVTRPDGDPEPALAVELHLHWLGQLGELLLRREQCHFQALAYGHLFDGFFTTKEDMFAVRPGTGLVSLDRDQRRGVAVIDVQVLTLGGGPDALLAVGRLYIEDFQLALLVLVV